MRTFFIVVALAVLLTGVVSASTILVPGTSDIWLAGMLNGATASIDDFAPGQSPVLVTGFTLTAGGTLTFSATGGVINTPSCPPSCNGPDGGSFYVHLTGAENGIANVTAPINSVMGIFLDASQPNLSAAPSALNFSTGLGINYLTLSPGLKQPFFIGDGLTSGSVQQTIVIPVGATRLFLGTMDGYEWRNNSGSFSVTVTQPPSDVPSPEPASLSLLAGGLFALAFWKRRRN